MIFRRAARGVDPRVRPVVAASVALPAWMGRARRTTPSGSLANQPRITSPPPAVIMQLAVSLRPRLPLAPRVLARICCGQAFPDRGRSGVASLAPATPVGPAISAGDRRPVTAIDRAGSGSLHG